MESSWFEGFYLSFECWFKFIQFFLTEGMSSKCTPTFFDYFLEWKTLVKLFDIELLVFISSGSYFFIYFSLFLEITLVFVVISSLRIGFVAFGFWINSDFSSDFDCLNLESGSNALSCKSKLLNFYCLNYSWTSIVWVFLGFSYGFGFLLLIFPRTFIF